MDGEAGLVLELGVHQPAEEADDVFLSDRQRYVATAQLSNIVLSQLLDAAVVAFLGAVHDTGADECSGSGGGGCRTPTARSTTRHGGHSRTKAGWCGLLTVASVGSRDSG